MEPSSVATRTTHRDKKQRKTSSAAASASFSSSSNNSAILFSPPIEMRCAPDRGRYLVASRDLQRGELVHVEAPYAVVIDSSMQTFVCAWCWKIQENTSPPRAEGTTTNEDNSAEEMDDELRFWSFSIRCESCKAMYYCSTECQENHYRESHSHGECALLTRYEARRAIKEREGHIWFASSDLTYFRFVVQIIAKLEKEIETLHSDKTTEELDAYYFGSSTNANNSNNDNIIDVNKSVTFQELWALVANRESFDEERIAYISKMVKTLLQTVISRTARSYPLWSKAIEKVKPKPKLKSKSFLPYKDPNKKKPKIMNTRLLELFCKLECNSFGIWLTNDDGIGMGVYPRCSYFNHSCAPTVGKLTSFILAPLNPDSEVLQGIKRVINFGNKSEEINKRLQLQWLFTLTNVRKGEELTYSYVDISAPGCVRRQELQQHYFFDCRCERCKLDVAIEAASAAEASNELVELKKKSQAVTDFCDWIVCKKPGCCGIIVTIENEDGSKLLRLCKFCGEEQILPNNQTTPKLLSKQ
eukprot:TRINITY_DN11609_c0_g1_i1.p1 TRINITY_DN11609_c0_g1~~TRINITY_DN11609_c0_g1_i1.p1  ORF type:complete len:583 (-),score=128.30 TRINITY_DN11609_c0_g1_i1:27-1613(-)